MSSYFWVKATSPLNPWEIACLSDDGAWFYVGSEYSFPPEVIGAAVPAMPAEIDCPVNAGDAARRNIEAACPTAAKGLRKRGKEHASAIFERLKRGPRG